MEILLKLGANLMDIDTKKTTCLHVAVIAGRSANVKFILDKCPQLLKLRDRQGMNAMAYACQNNDDETIKTLIENGQKIN